MLIKKLIQRLLDSRTTPSEAVVANRANNTGTNIAPLNTVTSSGGWTTILSAWAAPNDGYIKIFGNIVKLDASVTGGSFAIIGTALHGSFSGPAIGSSLRGFLPLRKGESVTIMAVNARDIVVTFYSKIVGGHNHFIWRALSCLRALSNFSQRNSFLAEATGFLTNPIQLFKRRISRLQRQENGFLSSLLATGGSASKGLPRKFCLATGRFGRGAIQQRHLIKAFVFLSQKAGLWPTYYRQTPRAHMPSLFRVSAINSFQTGGALC